MFRRIFPFSNHPGNPDFYPLSPVRRLFCHPAAIMCFASGPLSRVLVTGPGDGSIKIWTIPDFAPLPAYQATNSASPACPSTASAPFCSLRPPIARSAFSLSVSGSVWPSCAGSLRLR
jgi:WD40 repeat protein